MKHISWHSAQKRPIWECNYRDFANAMNDPQIYASGANYVAANYAWQAAGWFWTNNNINARILSGATVADVTRIVRGDAETWEERYVYYTTFLEVLT